jgi:hypothetical protein
MPNVAQEPPAVAFSTRAALVRRMSALTPESGRHAYRGRINSVSNFESLPGVRGPHSRHGAD